MNKLATILSTYKSLGVIPAPSNFEAVVSILQELNFRKETASMESMSRAEVAEWLVDFIQSNKTQKVEKAITTTEVVPLVNTGTNRLLSLRMGTKGDIRDYNDDYDDMKSGAE